MLDELFRGDFTPEMENEPELVKRVKEGISKLGVDQHGAPILGSTSMDYDGEPIKRPDNSDPYIMPSGQEVNRETIEWVSKSITRLCRHSPGKFKLPIDRRGGILVWDFRKAIWEESGRFYSDEIIVHAFFHPIQAKNRYDLITDRESYLKISVPSERPPFKIICHQGHNQAVLRHVDCDEVFETLVLPTAAD